MITLKQTKSYLQFATSDYDSLLQDIIGFSVGYIENYIGYSLKHSEFTELFQGTGRQFLPIGKCNITKISNIKIDDIPVEPTKYTLSHNMVLKIDGLWEKKYIDSQNIDYNIKITYNSGYSYPLVSDIINESNVPKEIQYVALELAKRIFIKCGTQQQTSQESGSQKSASMSTSYFEIKFTEDLPKDLKRILNKYIR